MVLLARGHQPRLVGEDHRLCSVAQVELGEDAADVRLHRLLGQREGLGDLRVGPTAGDQGKNLGLAFRQPFEPQRWPAPCGGTLLGEVCDEAPRRSWATTRTAAIRSAGGASCSRNPLAPARSAS